MKEKKKGRWIRRGSLLAVVLLVLAAMLNRFGIGGGVTGWIESVIEPPTVSQTAPSATASPTVSVSADVILVRETTVYLADKSFTVEELKVILKQADRATVFKLRDDKANNATFEQVEALLKELELKYIIE